MNLNDLLPTKHLRAYDLRGTEPVVTIAALERLPLGKTRELKWIVRFVGKEKYLICNATLLRQIGAIAGEETDRWVGAVVQLFPTTTKNPAGQQVPVVRVKQPTKLPQLVQRGGRT